MGILSIDVSYGWWLLIVVYCCLLLITVDFESDDYYLIKSGVRSKPQIWRWRIMPACEDESETSTYFGDGLDHNYQLFWMSFLWPVGWWMWGLHYLSSSLMGFFLLFSFNQPVCWNDSLVKPINITVIITILWERFPTTIPMMFP